ncbi:Bem46 protein [Cupriavidus sp. U2]|uniref:alpha/beta hydrolase n=1 Tax=Cupriavidus sp. U2 TaxID=2920269 RepID=UPI00129DB5CB|nr:alpha/beta hydrolase [Cupriavidus sp. U2]KAI3589122.1 Bem46 protein [Cupriavidus sp. U2]
MPPVPTAQSAPLAYRRWFAGALGLAGLAVMAGVGRLLLYRAIERDAFGPGQVRTLQPDDLGVASRQFTFKSGDRALRASWVAAANPAAPALAVFHGDEECLADWAPVQALLHGAGISSFVFDYSGYGASTGTPSVSHLREDALAAFAQFRATAPLAARHYVMGYSLGSGVLLDVLDGLRPLPDGLVIGAGFSSARAAAVATGLVPGWLAWALPNPWNNIARLRASKLPVMLIHSRRDETIPFRQAEHLARAAHGPSRLVVFEDLPHNAAIETPFMKTFWAPVIAWLQGGRLQDD